MECHRFKEGELERSIQQREAETGVLIPDFVKGSP